MIAYNYNSENGYYGGEVVCQKDPIASRIEGRNVWLTPGDCTLVKPPEYNAKTHYAIWNGKDWHLEEIPPEPEYEEPSEPKEVVFYDELVDFTKQGVDSTISS